LISRPKPAKASGVPACSVAAINKAISFMGSY
jgi:hypothetical protein